MSRSRMSRRGGHAPGPGPSRGGLDPARGGAGPSSGGRPGRRQPHWRLPRGAPGQPRRPLGWRVAAGVAVAVVLAVTAGSLYVYVQYRSVWGSIHRIGVADLGKRPPQYNDALNILVFGTDSRAGLSAYQQVKLHVGPAQGAQNTDTIMLVHLAPGRHGVTVISLPRDTQVPYYACPAAGNGEPGQQRNMAATERINAVLAAGGESCLWKTVEQQTGVRIDHFVELHFTGFVNVVNDLGGVNVCVRQPVNDAVSGLQLHRGYNHLYGVAALKFWRTREGVGNGDDPQRIIRDQFLMASLLQKIKHDGLLGDPARTLAVVKDVASSMTVDQGMTETDLLHIAESLRGLSAGSVQFITAPFMPDPANANVVDFAQPQAGSLFAALAHDRKLPRARGKGRHRTAAGGTTLARRAARPASVSVQVLNGSGAAGRASAVAAGLASRGFHVVGTGDGPNFGYTTSVVEYAGAADLPAARAVQEQLGSATLVRDSSLTPGTLSLIVGSSFTALAPLAATPSPAAAGSPAAGSPVGPASAAPSPARSAAPVENVRGLGKKYHGITGSAPACGVQSSFSGSLGY